MRSTNDYCSHSFWSDPGRYAELIKSWSDDPTELSLEISRHFFHIRGNEAGYVFNPELHADDLRLRTCFEILDKSLRHSTPGKTTKVAGVCRDFALLAVSAFRQKDIPARLRAGFANYFIENFYEDHWLCEWFDGDRWKLLDVEVTANLDLSIYDFDPTDIPSQHFLTGKIAWQQMNSGKIDPRRIGVSALNIKGLWFVAGNMHRDAAALVKLELKPWDYWGSFQETHMQRLDANSECILASDALSSILQELAEYDLHATRSALTPWLPRQQLTSFPTGIPEQVSLIWGQRQSDNWTDREFSNNR